LLFKTFPGFEREGFKYKMIIYSNKMNISKYILLVFLTVVSLKLCAQIDYVSIQAKSTYTGGWGNQQTKLVTLIPGFSMVTDGKDDYTRYGTNKYLRTDSTGFFYVKKIDDRWWMVDPNGYAGINIGVCSFASGNVQNDYDLVKQNGFNGSGNFLSSEGQTSTIYNPYNYNLFSYTRRLNFFLNYKNVRNTYYPNTPSTVLGNLDYVTVFDPAFATYCDQTAKSMALPAMNERDLLGYFTDNEINFNQDQLQNLVRDLPAGDACRDSALVFAASRGLTATDCINYSSNVTETIKQDFAILLATKYFKTVSAAIRKYDPNHLILGSRLNGRPRAIQGVVNASEKYMDVTSVNFYDKFSPNDQIALSTWTNDKPCIVTEFYIKDINVLPTTQSGAGWYVNNQAARGDFYQNTCLQLLKNKCFIGWQYFKYQDDSDSNKGMVNGSGTEYTGMTSLMNELNSQVYHLCDFYDSKNRRPGINTRTKVLPASADTYLIPGATSVTNYGTETELAVRNNARESNIQEAFLKFDFSAMKDSLKYLKHAQLDLYCTQTDASVRSIFVSGILDASWQELTLTGALRNANALWNTTNNRLDYQKSAIATGNLSFDVSTWVNEKSINGVVSFKIEDLTLTNTSIKIASKEYPDQTHQPKLTLTFYNSNPTDVNPAKNDIQHRISPNPATDNVTIVGNDVTETELLNLNGQLLFKTNLMRIDLSNLKKGLYLVRMKTDSGKSIIDKLLVN